MDMLYSSTLIAVSWADFWSLLNSPLLGFIGVVIAVYISNRHNSKQLKSANEQAEKLANLRAEEIKEEIRNRTIERDIAIGKIILPKTMDAVQAAFSHLMKINGILNKASLEARFKADLNLALTPDKFHETLREIRAWYDDYCLYLPNSIRRGFIGLLNHCHSHVDELFADRQSSNSKTDIWDMYIEKSNSVEVIMMQFMEKYDLFDKKSMN